MDKEIKFFNENDNCPICNQDIEHHFKHKTVENKLKKLIEVKEALEKIDNDIIQLIKKRVYDCTATTGQEVSVFFNGKKLEYKSDFNLSTFFIGNVECKNN